MNIRYAFALALLAAGFASCKKDDSPAPASTATTCTIIINDTLTITPDSIHYDYYANLPRIQAFKNAEATFTLWPGTFNSGTTQLNNRYLFWIYKTGIYTPANSAPGSLSLTNDGGVLSGSFSASGLLDQGSGPAAGKVTATFARVKQAK